MRYALADWIITCPWTRSDALPFPFEDDVVRELRELYPNIQLRGRMKEWLAETNCAYVSYSFVLRLIDKINDNSYGISYFCNELVHQVTFDTPVGIRALVRSILLEVQLPSCLVDVIIEYNPCDNPLDYPSHKDQVDQ